MYTLIITVLIQKLTCIEKDELNEKKVEMDVMNAIVQFEKKGFITFQNKY